MAHCPMCFPWNTPLTMRPFFVIDSGHVPLSFAQWLLYRLHVEMHQAGAWAGEIEQYAAELKATPTFPSAVSLAS